MPQTHDQIMLFENTSSHQDKGETFFKSTSGRRLVFGEEITRIVDLKEEVPHTLGNIIKKWIISGHINNFESKAGVNVIMYKVLYARMCVDIFESDKQILCFVFLTKVGDESTLIYILHPMIQYFPTEVCRIKPDSYTLDGTVFKKTGEFTSYKLAGQKLPKYRAEKIVGLHSNWCTILEISRVDGIHDGCLVEMDMLPFLKALGVTCFNNNLV